MKAGNNIIVDNTNYLIKTRKKYIDLAKKHGYETKVIIFKNPIDFCKHINFWRASISNGNNKIVPDVVYNKIKKNMENVYDNEFDTKIEILNKFKLDSSNERKHFNYLF